MAGLRRPQPGCYCRTAAAVNLLLGVFQVLLPCCRPGGAQGQAIEPLPNVVELWQAEEGELLLPTQGDSEEDMEERSQEQRYTHPLEKHGFGAIPVVVAQLIQIFRSENMDL